MATTRDEPPLAVDKVRYLYEAVAAVAAIDEEIAEEACELIKVDYEELPGVFDPEEAMKEGRPGDPRLPAEQRERRVPLELRRRGKGLRRILHRPGGPVRDGQGDHGLSGAARLSRLL